MIQTRPFHASDDLALPIPSGATNGRAIVEPEESIGEAPLDARHPASVEHLLPVSRNAFGAAALGENAARFLAGSP